MRASWFGSLRPTGYKVAARVPRARQRAPLGCVIPTTNSVPPCSRLSRRGLEMTEHAGTAERQPALTAPARVGLHHMWVGAKKRESQVEQRNWNEESGERCEIVLDFASLIQGGMSARRPAHDSIPFAFCEWPTRHAWEGSRKAPKRVGGPCPSMLDCA